MLGRLAAWFLLASMRVGVLPAIALGRIERRIHDRGNEARPR
jgi:hypothetical protein